MAALAYFITFRTYGTWLHGCERGSVDDEHNVVGQPRLGRDAAREAWERSLLRHEPLMLDAERRYVVEATVREVWAHRRWTLLEVHVRTTHVHVIVSAPQTPERVMNDLKAYGTRRMREAGVLGEDVYPWAEHGSTRYINDQESLGRAVEYVVREQGEELEKKCPEGWRGGPVR